MSTQPIDAWLQHLDRLQLRSSKSIQVRNLALGESLPMLPHGLPATFVPTQPEWVWIAYTPTHPLALLIAGPVQNFVFLARICAASDSLAESTSALMLLLRRALSDMLRRGYLGYMVALDTKLPAELRLQQIVEQAGGSKICDAILMQGPTAIGDK